MPRSILSRCDSWNNREDNISQIDSSGFDWNWWLVVNGKKCSLNSKLSKCLDTITEVRDQWEKMGTYTSFSYPFFLHTISFVKAYTLCILPQLLPSKSSACRSRAWKKRKKIKKIILFIIVIFWLSEFPFLIVFLALHFIFHLL